MPKIWFERTPLPQFAHLYEGFAEPLGPGSDTPDDPLQALPEADGIIASALTYDGALMDLAPKLKVIARTGIGYDKVDIEAARARNIIVCNTPEGPTISTAEHTILLMLAAAKTLKQSERKLREGAKEMYRDHTGIELYQTTLGLAGFGRIARRVARTAQALGMRVMAHDPYVYQAQASELNVTLTDSLESLLQAADVVSLHVPLNPDTHHLMNADRFALMKPGAVFVNAGRGGLVDEAALLAALESGHLFSAGLDVTDPEPAHPDNPLLHRENVYVTPHIASATQAGKARIFESALSQVIQVLQGERPPYAINPEVIDGS